MQIFNYQQRLLLMIKEPILLYWSMGKLICSSLKTSRQRFDMPTWCNFADIGELEVYAAGFNEQRWEIKMQSV